MILDVCCGSRMFWFDKKNEKTIYGDIRFESHTLCDGRSLVVKPDIQYDFKKLPFQENVFDMVVFDPPHIDNLSPKAFMALKYGRLIGDWKSELSDGFKESFRVLKPECFLIFKWNETRIKLNDVLKLTNEKKLFGHVTGRQGKTFWVTFIKLKK